MSPACGMCSHGLPMSGGGKSLNMKEGSSKKTKTTNKVPKALVNAKKPVNKKKH